jgi:hypothetical protein
VIEEVESGELRLLFVLTDFDGLEPSAISEDFKTGMRTWVRFAWMTPGEVLVRDLDGLDEAKGWVAG